MERAWSLMSSETTGTYRPPWPCVRGSSSTGEAARPLPPARRNVLSGWHGDRASRWQPGAPGVPKEALKAMEYLRIHVGDSAIVEIDANQTDQSPMSLNDGPVESLLWTEELGCCFPIGT